MAINIGNFVVKGREPKVQTPAPPANLSALNVGQLVVINPPIVEEVQVETIPLDGKRPIFNSLIDNKESSRYILDMMK
jgi:hypothetical protein